MRGRTCRYNVQRTGMARLLTSMFVVELLTMVCDFESSHVFCAGQALPQVLLGSALLVTGFAIKGGIWLWAVRSDGTLVSLHNYCSGVEQLLFSCAETELCS